MSNRITDKDLNNLVARLNAPKFGNETNLHLTPGAYVLDYAYGGVKLNKICNTSGGCMSVSTHGYGTKKELYIFLQGMLATLNA